MNQQSWDKAFIMAPILGSLSLVLTLVALILYSCGQRSSRTGGGKNPYTMLTLGLLLLKVIVCIHLIISIFRIEENSLVCQFEGLALIFVIFTASGYYFSLAHLVLKASVVFNPGEMKSKNYHIYSIVFGLAVSIYALILDDVGITSFNSCGTARGSLHELAYGIMIFIIWPYIIFSAVILILKWRRERLMAAQKNLYLIHILGVVTFTVSWMPFILVHFFSFAIPTVSGFTVDHSSNAFRFISLALFCISGSIFSIFRFIYCSSLKSIIKNMRERKWKCDDKFDYFLKDQNDPDQRTDIDVTLNTENKPSDIPK